mmetsp:Transcript_52751/g.137436  ORF Transcript_52751/g.137436 Transcript_52751/m.137436 type:complete len:308 (-) Transcript_52751:566-1489(-)
MGSSPVRASIFSHRRSSRWDSLSRAGGTKRGDLAPSGGTATGCLAWSGSLLASTSSDSSASLVWEEILDLPIPHSFSALLACFPRISLSFSRDAWSLALSSSTSLSWRVCIFSALFASTDFRPHFGLPASASSASLCDLPSLLGEADLAALGDFGDFAFASEPFGDDDFASCEVELGSPGDPFFGDFGFARRCTHAVDFLLFSFAFWLFSWSSVVSPAFAFCFSASSCFLSFLFLPSSTSLSRFCLSFSFRFSSASLSAWAFFSACSSSSVFLFLVASQKSDSPPPSFGFPLFRALRYSRSAASYGS